MDRHLRVLTSLGSNVEEYLSDGIEAAQVREELTSAGLEVREEIVEYFSWRSPQREEAILFREVMFWPSIAEALALREEMVSLMAPYGGIADDFVVSAPPHHDYAGEDIPEHPGPSFLLPVVYSDGVDFVAIDTPLRPAPHSRSDAAAGAGNMRYRIGADIEWSLVGWRRDYASANCAASRAESVA